MRGTIRSIARHLLNFTDAFSEDNIVAQPVSQKSAYGERDRTAEEGWNPPSQSASSRLKPPLGTYKDGQPDKEKKANKSAEGKAAFRLSIFNRPRIVNAGPRM